MVSEDDFHAALDADAGNPALRLVFADWLEERGDWRAEGYRWMGQHDKWPLDWSKSGFITAFTTFDWYLDDDGATWDVPGHCRLPPWWRLGFRTNLDFPAFPSRRLAEEGLCIALGRIPLRRRPSATHGSRAQWYLPLPATVATSKLQ